MDYLFNMSALRLTTARINIGLVINKLLARHRHKSTSEAQKEGIAIMLKDLDEALKIVVEVSKENEKAYRLNYSLHIENMKLRKQILELTKPKEDATL